MPHSPCGICIYPAFLRLAARGRRNGCRLRPPAAENACHQAEEEQGNVYKKEKCRSARQRRAGETMDAWSVVTVLISIVGLIGTVAVPLTKNTRAMTRLNEQLNHLMYRIEREERDLQAFKQKSALRHEKIFAQLEQCESQLQAHEGRLKALEEKEKRK